MAELKQSKRLKKELSLFGVYAIATGTTLSAGFFLLPGLAAVEAGPALVVSYLIAIIPLLPAVFSIVELSTAMPRAGGVYYFLDRTMGPVMGTIGGLGTWAVLMLKVSFALIGLGAYAAYFWPDLPMKPVGVGVALVLSAINLFGAKKTGKFQIALVVGLLGLLALFIIDGVPSIDRANLVGFFDAGGAAIFSTAGFVYVSYIGITTVASLSEEVRNPERTLPLAIFLALGTTILIYGLGTLVMVGTVPLGTLAGDLIPVATAAESFAGRTGGVIVSIAALLAFISVSNAGILSASRFPLAMSRDHIIPSFFARLGWHRIPFVSVAVTVTIIILVLLFLNPVKIAKLASAFQLLMFALVCLAVIVMRESRIDSYDPGYRSPLYPWMQIFGVLAPLVFIAKMGPWPSVFTVGLVTLSVLWYRGYARKRVFREGAMYHIFERLGRMRYEGLDRELRGILKEKGLRDADPFDDIVARSVVFDLDAESDFEDLLRPVSRDLSPRLPISRAEIEQHFLDGTRLGATPVTHGVALPHFRCRGLDHPEMVLVRSRSGIRIRLVDPFTDEESEEFVHAVFFLVSPDGDPARHLRILAQIAGRVESDEFEFEWDQSRDAQDLKEALLHNERYLSIRVGEEKSGVEGLAGKSLRDVHMPEGSLVALILRHGENIVPVGRTVLEHGDRLTVIGERPAIRECYRRFVDAAKR